MTHIKNVIANSVAPEINLANMPSLSRGEYIASHLGEFEKHRNYNNKLGVLLGAQTVFEVKKYHIDTHIINGVKYVRIALTAPKVVSTEPEYFACEGLSVEDVTIFLDKDWLVRNTVPNQATLRITAIPVEYSTVNKMNGSKVRQVGLHVKFCKPF